YLGVGSGNGKKAFVNHDSSNLTDGPKAPDNPPVASSTDFGPYYGTGTGAGWVKDATDSGPFFPEDHFAGSDDPLVPSDITAYNAHSNGWGAPVQFPSLVTTIAIPFHRTADWAEKGKKPSGGGNSSLTDLSTNTLCGIFNGDITDWSDPAIKADNGGVQLGSGPITVVYRSDGSGTTFLTSNGLISQCAATSHPIPNSWQTAPGNTAGAGGNSFFINAQAAGVLPANFTGANGSGGVKTAINSIVGSIGYLSPDFVQPVDNTGPFAANLQTWYSFTNGLAPVFKAPSPKNGTAIVAATKPPLFTAGSCPIGTAMGQSPDGKCAHNALNWGTAVPRPLSAAAYPLGGFSFFDTYTCFNSAADLAALANKTGTLGYFTWYYAGATLNRGIPKAQLAANGFSVVPASWMSAIKKLISTDTATKLSTPGTAKTGCASATGTGA
ncbi:MAG TPA: substrate-binding domain-containing protein, partial [Rhizomicrobium sp.]|nr:substrate-binding domain-containing protein [Rhizomicrobium sp.]